MNLNILSYIIYGLISIILTFYVGNEFHKNGYVYIVSIFVEKKISNAINNLLLIGFYLVNIGYVILKISEWGLVTNNIDLVEKLSIHLASIFIILAILNYLNISTLAIIKYKLINNKKQRS